MRTAGHYLYPGGAARNIARFSRPGQSRGCDPGSDPGRCQQRSRTVPTASVGLRRHLTCCAVPDTYTFTGSAPHGGLDLSAPVFAPCLLGCPPVRPATAVSGATPPSSEQASTIRARSASACDAVRFRASASSAFRSASASSSGTSFGLGIPNAWVSAGGARAVMGSHSSQPLLLPAAAAVTSAATRNPGRRHRQSTGRRPQRLPAAPSPRSRFPQPGKPQARPPFWVAVQEIIRSVADRVAGLPDCLGPGLDASAPVAAMGVTGLSSAQASPVRSPPAPGDAEVGA